MLPRNPFLKFVPRRAATALERLNSEIWVTTASADIHCRNSGVALNLPHHWGRIYQEQWFTLSLPPAGTDLPWLRWRDQAEATLYVDGEPFFGFDVAHRECLLPSDCTKLEIHAHCVQSAIWHPDAAGIDPLGSKLEGAEYLQRSEIGWKLYHDFAVLLELLGSALKLDLPQADTLFSPKGVMPDLTQIRPFTRLLLRRIDEIVDALDTQGPATMSVQCDKLFADLPAEAWNLKGTVTGHSHIDLVWLWPESIGEAKAVHTFTNVDYLMATYPEFRFGYSQPASYEAVERREPNLMKRVQGRIAENRWEALGALYVESDTLLPCGEALARSFELGQAGFKKINGEPSNILWLPDAFGYSGSLPQLMRHYGVDRFFTNKVTWNDSVVFPHTSFNWTGNDGSTVLAHIHPETVQYYNGCMTVPELCRSQDRHQQSDTHRELLIPTGYGDGGGGPTPEMCERVKRLENLATLPRCTWGRISDFYDRLETVRTDLPSYYGEILIQFHRGTYSSRSRFKALYRKIECALQNAELVAAALKVGPVKIEWWKRLVFSQFHDILPGSSVNTAFVELEREFADLNRTIGASIETQTTGSADEQMFNPTPFDRSYWVGEKVLTIGAFSSRPTSDAKPTLEAWVRADSHGIETPHYSLQFNPQGAITQLRFGNQDQPQTGPLNQIMLYPNRPHSFDAWEIDRQTLSLGEALSNATEITVHQVHAGLAEVIFEHRIGDKSRLNLTYRADALKNHVEIIYTFDWHHPHALVKAVFPTGYRGDHTRFAQPFGSTLRRQNSQSQEDEARWETPASRWIMLSDDGEKRGLTIATTDRYGFSNRHGTLGVTLLTSPTVTGEEAKWQNAFPRSLREDHPESIFTDQGVHHTKLILAPWDTLETPACDYPAALADYAFAKPIQHQLAKLELPLNGIEGMPSVYIAWVQPLPHGHFLAKIVETMGQRGRVNLSLKSGYTTTPVNGLHEVVGEALTDNAMDISPYQLTSLLIAAA